MSEEKQLKDALALVNFEPCRGAERPQIMPCFECDNGTMLPITLNYHTNHPNLGDITIPSVPMLRCDSCGDTVISQEGSAYIECIINALKTN